MTAADLEAYAESHTSVSSSRPTTGPLSMPGDDSDSRVSSASRCRYASGAEVCASA